MSDNQQTGGFADHDDRNLYAERPPRIADWLTEPIRENRATYIKVGVAAAVINLFGLVTSLFTMTVYDRVVPNEAIESLVALSIGLGLILIFDFVLRILRAYFVDLAGADIDRDVGRRVFDRLMQIRLDSRRGSTGALTGMMRELETLRDFFASASITALVDVPFIILTLAVIALIGGPIVFVPLAMIPLVLIAGLVTKPALDRVSARAMNGGLYKQGVLVESIGALETVKASGAGPMLRKRWIQAIDEHSDNSLRQRLISSIAITVATTVNTLSYAGVVIAGVFLVADGRLTVGGLVACSILSGRAVQPLTTIAGLMSRLSSTRIAYDQVEGMMRQPSEGPVRTPLRPSTTAGTVELRNVSFSYPGKVEKALDSVNLRVAAGERIALIGKVGSGKSTIARLVLGLFEPQEGLVLIDDNDIRQLSPTDMRMRIGTVVQETSLLSGTVRENILLDRPGLDDEEMLRAARLSGTHDFMGGIVNGYDLVLADRGEGLSGGQRQSISIARALAGRPPIMIFDEPTSAMDARSEADLLARLEAELKGRTVILVTHRPSLLRLVDRIAIVDRGKIVRDGPRDTILRDLGQERAAA
ncbi:type I secretion system permease/ATPase [Pseudopontixanthobacter vadosimaris]|uniref:type I secretion system permease/ATPase n=1 Tax=Pseudopontixanthobacter vadosimaris TaxID=2726450 RepID=UPI00147417B8|nr:type I secretion system permease/ATPase [Pseudopontixanthobacter vadosimaris]